MGESRLAEYFRCLHSLLAPGRRLLNHGISRPPGPRSGFSRSGFVDRYVFPDGELHEVGRVVSVVQEAGFEVRHVESRREHYALTLRRWVANLEAGLGPGGGAGGTGPGADLASLHGGGGAQRRGEPQPDPPRARGQERGWLLGDASAPGLGAARPTTRPASRGPITFLALRPPTHLAD